MLRISSLWAHLGWIFHTSQIADGKQWSWTADHTSVTIWHLPFRKIILSILAYSLLQPAERELYPGVCSAQLPPSLPWLPLFLLFLWKILMTSLTFLTCFWLYNLYTKCMPLFYLTWLAGHLPVSLTGCLFHGVTLTVLHYTVYGGRYTLRKGRRLPAVISLWKEIEQHGSMAVQLTAWLLCPLIGWLIKIDDGGDKAPVTWTSSPAIIKGLVRMPVLCSGNPLVYTYSQIYGFSPPPQKDTVYV